MRKIIAFAGQIGSGKTTAANELYALGFIRVRFAGPLKAMIRCLGLTEAHTDGDLKEEKLATLCGRTARYAMQTLGTEWGREMIGPDLWINLWKANVERNIKYAPIVCDDLRFANEAKAVRDLGGTIVYIARGAKRPIDHISEAIEFTADITIPNYGTKEEFLSKIRELT